MNTLDSHRTSSVDACLLTDIPVIGHEYGKIAVMENLATAPMTVRRVYYIYDVQAGAERGGHSHIATTEIVIALCGSFDVSVCDGPHTRRISLNRPSQGLILPPGIWRTLDNFSSGAVCLVLASEKFDEADYVRDFEEFKRLTTDKL